MQIDISKHLGAITRTVTSVQKDGKEAKGIIATRTYDTTQADLWDAITSAERIPRWFLPIEGELKLGGRYQFKGNAGGEITKCDAPKHLAVTWEFGGQTSWVDVVLSENPAGGTTLELTHLAHVSEHWEKFGPGAVGVGWDGGLMGLGEHLTGKPALVPADAMQWMVSDEGKAFYSGSAKAWGLADAASGTPEDVALASAERTRAAYTGEA